MRYSVRALKDEPIDCKFEMVESRAGGFVVYLKSDADGNTDLKVDPKLLSSGENHAVQKSTL